MALLPLLALLAPPAGGTVWYVDDDAPGDPGPGDTLVSDPAEDGSPAHPFDAIEEALLAAASGDVVELAPGTYLGVGNRGLSFGGKALTLRGSAGALACVIDGEQVERILTVPASGAGASRVEGLTFRAGLAPDGGALLIAAPDATVEGCIFVDNIAQSRGGAVFVEGSAGAFLGELRGCRFEQNTAQAGGALYGAASGGAIVGCDFLGNHAVDPVGTGGGVALARALTVEASLFAGNTSNFGGALHLDGVPEPVRVEGSRLLGNFAQGEGGGVFAASSALSLRSCVVADNGATFGSGGGVAASGSLLLAGCTVADNTALVAGGGLYLRDGGHAARDFRLTGSILFGNLSSQGAQAAQEGEADALHVEWCDVQGGAASISTAGAALVLGAGNVDVDPLFAAPAVWNFHLLDGSPCIDAGNPGFVAPPGAVDVDGEPRVSGGAVDLGADET
ncbi:MAG: right-handed parallel beta-helix repeat-containing protein [Planctomycetota bacterium]